MKFKQAKYFIISLLLIGLIGTGINFASAARTGSFWKRSGDAIIPNPSTLTIGTETNPISAGYFSILNASTSEIANLTISGASAGNLDMGGFAITNGGIFTATNFVATSTDDSTFAGAMGIGTTTPQRLLSVDAGASATTTTQFGDVYSGTAATCFEVAENDGSITSFYFVGGAIVIETNACL